MTDHNKPSDPLDDLLYAAFDRDMANVASIDISGQVMKSLQRRLRLRAAVLGLSAFLGLCLVVAFTLPGLNELLGRLASAQPLSPSLMAVLPVIVVGALAPWLLTMVDDRI
ncbi:MAG: hypothetical protein OES38_04515 [Gammaproteobacteria bacterium]|nr:hypothetical protein [Gammaproteobacteria bacterium]